MKAWELFEQECTTYLNNKFGKYADFKQCGGSISTESDILVTTLSGKHFYIEVKESSAQCGQFVLLPDIKSKTFKYSDKNALALNPAAKAIINYMNNNFELFKNAGKTGQNITMNNASEVFAEWIIQAYFQKNCKFFISKNFIIFPIEQCLDYFNINACYRVKRSGSSNVGKSKSKIVISYLENMCQYNNIREIIIDDTKIFVTSNTNIHNVRFIIDDTEYMFSERGDKYEIRKLSNTFNANVIFSVTLKNNKTGLSDAEIISLLH